MKKSLLILALAPLLAAGGCTHTVEYDICVYGASSAGVIAAGYSCWNVGIEKGDMGALSIASYATPVLSSVASSVLLGQVPGMTFWAGVVAVAAGALLCFVLARRGVNADPFRTPEGRIRPREADE